MNQAGCPPLGIDGAGTFDVEIGPRIRDRFVAAICGHRTPGRVDVSLTISSNDPGSSDGPGQRWRRTVGGRGCTTSVTTAPTGDGFVVMERRGPVELCFEHHADRSVSHLRLTAWSLRLGRRCLRLPNALMPDIDCRTERIDATALRVAVRISSRNDRTILSYVGVLR